MSKLIISAVPVGLLDHMFPKCIGHISRVVDKAPNDMSLESVKSDLYSGKAMLVTISEGEEVIAVNVITADEYPTGWKVMYIPITGGDRMEEWLGDFMKIAHALARDYGCDEIRGMACRKGWLKVLEEHDWYPVHQVIGCKVKAKEEI